MRTLALLVLVSMVVRADEARCSVLLTQTGDQKINVIKIVREYTGLGLREAKDLVDGRKPTLIREGLTRPEADALVELLAAKGATAEVRQMGEHPTPKPRSVEAKLGNFGVRLESIGSAKIQVIKIVRDRTGLGLAETKKLVESAPVMVKEGESRPVAESMVKELTAVGATATLVLSR